MLTAKSLNSHLQLLYNQLSTLGFKPDRMILFGSYASGKVHAYSDVDVAIWNKNFSGSPLSDMELIRPVIRNFRRFDIKFYPSGATADNFDPFISVIEKTGKEILFYEQEKQT